MKLTIGMAHYEDSDLLWATIQSLKVHHKILEKDVEIVIVDNGPNSANENDVHGRTVKNIAYWLGNKGNVVFRPDLSGTTQPRQHIFDIAKGDFVLVMDCHVLLEPGSIDRILEMIDSGELEDDLYTGPIVLDDINRFQTHFNMTWGAQMWGQWGNAWQCPGCDQRFAVMSEGRLSRFITLEIDYKRIKTCNCNKRLPICQQQNIHQAMADFGATILGVGNEPFEIPAMGLGLFLAKRESWLGFNPDFRGFGGEEGYIHAKYKNAGRKTMCLPWLKWNHKFSQAKPYPVSMFNKIRNYCLGFQEIGRDPEEMFDHFVSEGVDYGIIADIWSDPHNAKEPKQGMMAKDQKRYPEGVRDIGDLLEWCVSNPRDLDQHFERITTIAASCATIAEFSIRRESTVPLLITQPEKLWTFNAENDPRWQSILERVKLPKTDWEIVDRGLRECEPDLLFIDGPVDDHVIQLIKGIKPKKYVIVHDTQDYDSLRNAGKVFLEANPEWFIYSHDGNQHGLTVLCKIESERPTEDVDFSHPGTIAWKALHSFTMDVWDADEANEWYLAKWKPMIPNLNCNCRKHWSELEEKYPPVFTTEEAFFDWGVFAHNEVNKRLEKPIFSRQLAGQMYPRKSVAQ